MFLKKEISANQRIYGNFLESKTTRGFKDEDSQVYKLENIFDIWQEETKKRFIDGANCILRQQHRSYKDEKIGFSVSIKVKSSLNLVFVKKIQSFFNKKISVKNKNQ